jgi:prepilin peptidase CpaA
MFHSPAIPIGVVLVAAAAAAVTDIWKFKVHNVLTMPLLLTGLIYHAAVGGRLALASSLYGAMAGFGLLLVLYLIGGMGAGDVKFMAAVGAWLGWPLILLVFLASALVAGAYAVILLVTYGNFRETWVSLQIVWHRVATLGRHLSAENNIEVELDRTDRRRRLIPFTAAVAVGIVLTLATLLLA